MATEEIQAQPAPAAVPVAETKPVVQPAVHTPARDAASESFLVCQWVGCGDRLPNAEALYDHVCERHVGRKSTNNLNLTCQWGACRTTTVKRDHITSHMRVHVPLKPHKCEFCGKSFKRPQDLKKHVKTHAEDSVLIRSPESNMNGQQNGQNGFPGDNKGFYSGHDSVNGNYPAPNGQQGNGNSFPSNPYPQPYSGYGQVNYPGTTLADQQSMDTRRRAIEALNDFLGDVRRRTLNPHEYYDVGQRLNTQALPLPVSIGAGYSIGNGYNSNSNAVSHHHNNASNSFSQMLESFSGSGGVQQSNGGVQGALTQNYSLPMSNARTKTDLLDIDRFLEQLQSTVYESSGHAAAAGVQQPGVHTQLSSGYGGFNDYHRSSHSPPTHQTPASSISSASQPLSSVAQMASMTASSQGLDTPALTPASVSSYASSGHSPVSSHSNRGSGDGSSMYPQLPSVTGMSDIGSGYTSAPPSGLASGFDGYDSRRYTGGRLQREAPARDVDAMEVDTEGQRTPRKLSVAKERPSSSSSSSNVDPALRSATEQEASATSSPHSESADDKAQEAWVENVRVIEQLRNWLRERLASGDFERDADSTPEPADKAPKEEAREEEQATDDAPVAYPTLATEA